MADLLINFIDLFLHLDRHLGELLQYFGVWTYVIIFLIIRAINKLRPTPPAAVPTPATKDCPFCQTAIPVKAVRCPNCTSELKG